jgi:hypothetical protein
MQCSCGTTTIVKDSRRIPDGVWRRRHCNACGMTFTTVEQICETLKNTRAKTAGKKATIVVDRPAASPAPRPKRSKRVQSPVSAYSPPIGPSVGLSSIDRSARKRIEQVMDERELAKLSGPGY